MMNAIHMRAARTEDLPAIVQLFAIPDLDIKKNEAPGLPLLRGYHEAFERIEHDPNNRLWVADLEGRVVGAFQLTVIQYLANRGGRIAVVENVVVAPDVRSRGVGETMMRWAMTEARTAGCFRLQLTSNKARTRAHAFYARLGFVRTHEGFKLLL